MNRATKTFVISVISFIGIILLVLVVIAFLPDSKAPNEKLTDTRTLPVGSNGFEFFDQAGKVRWYPDEDDRFTKFLNDEEWDDELANKVLSNNTESYALYSTGLSCDFLKTPEISSFSDEMPYLSTWRDIARINQIRAKSFFNAGEQEKALSVVFDTLRFGDMVSRNADVLIVYLVGNVVKLFALDTLRNFANSPAFDAIKLTSICKELAKYHDDGVGMKSSFAGEYALINGFLKDLADDRIDLTQFGIRGWFHRLLLGMYFKPNTTAEAFRSFYQNCYNIGDKPFYALADNDLPSFKKKSTIAMFFSGNMFGELLYSLVLPSIPSIFSQRARYNNTLNVTLITLVLKAHFDDNGFLPDSLTPVADILGSVPLDEFDGKPLRYSRENKLVYSVGENKKDDGGVSDDNISDEVPIHDDDLFPFTFG